MKKNNTRGGARPGAGRNPVKEKRIVVSLSVLPSVLEPFKKKHGRAWSRQVEAGMKKDLE